MKGNDQVIQEFNEIVNMTASELEKWLKSDDSNSAGWPKEDENGETVGHDSGRKIVDILKDNPKKDADKYTEEQIEHMRKVVSYCKRHLAQESKTNSEKSPEEVKKIKSYASLKNWGHDFLKAKGKQDEGGKEEKKSEEKEEEKQEEEKEDNDDEKQTGDKRKATRSQTGSNKKRETRKGESDEAKNDDDEQEDEEMEEAEDNAKDKKQTNGKETKSNGSATNGKSKKDEKSSDSKSKDEKASEEDDKDEATNGSTPKKGPKKGDTVSWNWGQGQPEGKVLDVKADDTTITTKKGNQVSRKGDEEDPAVVIDTGKSKAIKSNHELN
ncbi:hypothetical protein FALBO_7016 [Fusarium albosuccineum]|uniref:Hypervirulence associated protein TUDOR domain-containing protein n=1 Tax=Fusarium albosuccineum TaxID=1237068 RepID=A0A8H4PCV5_9HYPO|nr:hypothetical protein FALBO_7016 [Fusarium albosuccineum]